MAAISAKLVKELREKTGVGMMACKKALVESNGDMDAAIDLLRKAGEAKAEKKAHRATKQGSIFTIEKDGVAVMAEILAETDFVAKNEKFQNLGKELVERVATEYTGNGDISEEVAEKEKTALTDLIGVIGENMVIRRVIRWESEGKFGAYLHGGGKLGVLVDAIGDLKDVDPTDICMHIAAFNPEYIVSSEIPADVIAKEREIAAEQMAGKPANIIDKIVDGKINKWYSEACLMNQPWLRDDKSSLAKLAPELTVARFVRWQVGEEL